MEMKDQREINAPPAVVWAALFDPEVLKASVPGCESLTGSAEEGFEAVVVQKVGPVKARFSGKVSISDVTQGAACTLSGEGQGGVAGFARGAAHVRLSPTAGGTLLEYDVEAKVGGKLAQLGSRIIDGFARKMAEDFFARFQSAVEPPEPEATDSTENGASAPEGPEGAPKKGWFRRIVG
jgi:carbon monoxide dehydrogenase subunit G